jgi:hypothetical protein
MENRIFNQQEDELAVVTEWVENHSELVEQWLGN